MKKDLKTEAEEKITYRFELNIEAPLTLKDMPSHIHIEYLITTLPYTIEKYLGENTKVVIKELPEKN